MEMQRMMITRLLAILLTFSMIGEFTACLKYEDAITVEVDTDGEEEENKEDKLRDYVASNISSTAATEPQNPADSFHFPFHWNTPVIDSITPPPELV